MAHQRAGAFQRGVVDALNDVFGRAGLDRRAVEDRRTVASAAVKARGCGLMTMALPALSEISVL
jgi:hypothetical protein